MLSSEIATSLSGRYVSVDIYPLSFLEYFYFKGIKINSFAELVAKKIEINREFEEFLKYGGFPKHLEYDEANKKELLLGYKDSILLKDIVARFQLKNFSILEDIAAFLLSNSGILQSISKIKNNFGISHDMAKDYLDYLKKAYMIFEVYKFDYSLKKQNANEKKYYTIDLGLSNLLRVPNLKTRGSDIEGVVFLELQRRGYKVYYYKTATNHECDFIVQKENKIVMLIQVTLSLKDEKTKKKELGNFAKTISELKLEDVGCLVITEERSKSVSYENIDIEIINIKEWLIL